MPIWVELEIYLPCLYAWGWACENANAIAVALVGAGVVALWTMAMMRWGP